MGKDLRGNRCLDHHSRPQNELRRCRRRISGHRLCTMGGRPAKWSLGPFLTSTQEHYGEKATVAHQALHMSCIVLHSLAAGVVWSA